MSKISRVGVLSRSFSKTKKLRNAISAEFDKVYFNDTGRTLNDQELVNFCSGLDAIILGIEKLTDSILSKMESVKVISKYGVGTNNIDFVACKRHDKEVLLQSGTNSICVAELAICSILSVLHKVEEARSIVKSYEWRQVMGSELYGKKVGIVGMGDVCSKLVQMLQGFKVEVIGYDNSEQVRKEWKNKSSIKVVNSLETLLLKSDIVSLHIPFNKETKNLFGSRVLNLIRPNGILMNLSRGGIVDEAEVIKFLDDKKLAFYITDVLEAEPEISNQMASHEKVFLTPHIGGSSYESVIRMGEAAIQNLVKYQKNICD